MGTFHLSQQAQPFLADLETWLENLPGLLLSQAAGNPLHTAIISIDVIRGFCNEGPLSSLRVGKIVQPIVNLLRSAWGYGMRNIILAQDTHEPDAVEFSAWPVHCVRGTPEAETVAEIKALPFYNQMVIFQKNSIHPGLNTGLNQWITQHPEVDTYIVVGDCTDICTYQLAMHLRMEANARQVQRRVIVPEDCTNTYDRPLEAARSEGGFAHPGDLLHAVFLYHMALNGIEVVSRIE